LTSGARSAITPVRSDRATDTQRSELVAANAARLVVSAAIHPADYIFHFVMTHPSFASDDARVASYFSDGKNSANRFLRIAHEHLPAAAPPLRVLEFASG